MASFPHTSHGSGPGVITPDGCAVDCYSLLPPGRDPEIIHGAIPPGACILELGAGAGRVTHALLRLGHPVVAVDESPEMLERINGAETVRGRIETLDLGRRFDAVVLASHFVNAPKQELRRTLLRACRRHTRDGGCVVVQRHELEWFDSAAPSERSDGGITFRLRDVSRPAPGLLSATVEYQVGDRLWRQSFTAARVDDADLAADLAAADLALDAFLTGDRTWVRAVPRP
ncbi:MAG TPA: class I SAM-dependent methyltransferase [Actinomycetes bacterium]|jgi:SAM-dependent methyltransferase|nr:class I SAM-dependent methyltransferase [Actinomycetes bacterium]